MSAAVHITVPVLRTYVFVAVFTDTLMLNDVPTLISPANGASLTTR